METETAPSPADRCTSTLDGIRASIAAEGMRKGPAGALAKAILRLLETLMALLAEFKAGTLSAPAPGLGATPPPPRSSRPNPTAKAGEEAFGAAAAPAPPPPRPSAIEGEGEEWRTRCGPSGGGVVPHPFAARAPRRSASRPNPSREEGASADRASIHLRKPQSAAVPDCAAIRVRGRRSPASNRIGTRKGLRFKKRHFGHEAFVRPFRYDLATISLAPRLECIQPSANLPPATG
jgi:hypothetical protein